ncbi:hypothetical protein VB636_21200 [Paracoccus sp. APAP_BH8]|nr:hypothetical protein [Paracoccus pantotrophus]
MSSDWRKLSSRQILMACRPAARAPWMSDVALSPTIMTAAGLMPRRSQTNPKKRLSGFTAPTFHARQRPKAHPKAEKVQPSPAEQSWRRRVRLAVAQGGYRLTHPGVTRKCDHAERLRRIAGGETAKLLG